MDRAIKLKEICLYVAEKSNDDPSFGVPKLNGIEHEEYSSILTEYRKLYDRMDEVWRDIEWKLSRNARIGTRIDDTEYWVFEIDQIGSMPGFWILYRYYPEMGQLVLLSMKAVHLGQA